MLQLLVQVFFKCNFTPPLWQSRYDSKPRGDGGDFPNIILNPPLSPFVKWG